VNIRLARVVLSATTHDTKDKRHVRNRNHHRRAAGRLAARPRRGAGRSRGDPRVVLGAHARHAGQLAPEVFSRYLAGQLDLGTHASYGRLLVAGTQEGVLGFAAFYPDASVQGSGFPSGWAEVRVLAVHPGADGPAVARALPGACERLAAEAGAPVLAIRTASLMTDAIASYERLGYRGAPEFDGTEPVRSVAHLRYVAQMYMILAR
jgi:GNAT superfamily N-acetyltransferase